MALRSFSFFLFILVFFLHLFPLFLTSLLIWGPTPWSLFCTSSSSHISIFLLFGYTFFFLSPASFFLFIPIPLLFHPSYYKSAYLPPLFLSYLPFSTSSSIQDSSLSLCSTFPWFLHSFRFFFLHPFVLVLHVYLLISSPIFSSFYLPFLFFLSLPHSIFSRLEGYYSRLL